MNDRLLPEYKTPPLNEVVFGITFKPIDKMKVAHLGLFWNIIKEEFPKCEQAPVIGSKIDNIIEKETGAPVPRIWLINVEDDHLIQMQKNKFLFNWRKREKNYPHFEDISKKFFEHIEKLISFVSQNELGIIEYENFELTYVNHISKGEGWENIKDIGSLFPDISWRDNDSRYLKYPEAITWQSVFNLPEEKGKLIVKLQSGLRKIDNESLIILEITARGIGSNQADNGLHEWFNMAHESIVLSFKDLTSDAVQKDIWGRIRDAENA